MASRKGITSKKGYEWVGGICLLGSLLFFTSCSKSGAVVQAAKPLSVAVIQVQTGNVPVSNEWVGTMDGYVNAQIQPQVSGYLVKQLYREGSVVRQGEVLFQIDPRPFQALLDQAQAQVEQAQGALGQAQAQLELANINVARDTPLAAQRAIAQSLLDNEKQQKVQQEAAVKAAQAQIAASKAAVETAKLNLGFTQVHSLITGIAGQATTQVGNLVSPQSVLTSVSQMDPIKVYFSISDAEYLALTAQLKDGSSDLLRNASSVPLTLHLSDGSTYPHTGKIVFVDRQMNQQTGAIRIAAAFPNPGNMLRPGQFGRVSANTQVHQNAILIPQAAITDLQGQKQVFTVDSDNKVHVTNITVGAEVGADVVVLNGLQGGATVITDNLQKLSEGTPVAPHPVALAMSGSGDGTGAK